MPRLTHQEKIAKAYRVPPWIAGIGAKPKWWQRPLLRLQAAIWSRRTY